MQRISLPWLALAAVIALTACQTTADLDAVTLTGAPDADVARVAVARPWKGWYGWVVASVDVAEEGELSTFGDRCAAPADHVVYSEGRGQLSHMGRVAFTNDHCVQKDGSYAGVMTFTAADGSSVFARYAGRIALDGTGKGLEISSEFTIEVGTGRFEGASGGGPGGAWLALSDLPALMTGDFVLREWIDGTIVYAPGASLGR